MADTPKRLYGPAQLTASAATLYTAPALTKMILRYLHVVNTTGTDRTFTLSIGTDAAATRLFSAITIPGGAPFDWTGFIPLEPGDFIQAYASAATALTLIVAGIEVT